ncbi:VIT family protein [Mesorhizobium sp. LHD-90]|uniref:VIT family protein n=1 Tax=Mesorhizobium sp. LHD-90 TaxID=3071414 RepID=UPI0027E16DE0|nr:VIT family protein [Mesorhizobium sp. LHD-90]MDQ6436579.1 VIT family protein [Mesorhizobium sp. LHD-90]
MGTDQSITQGESMAARKFCRVLDPSDRAGEILFGLIMVLTFTLSLGATTMGRVDVLAVLLGALGCNLAWGIIDAVMYLMGVRAEHGLAASTVRAIRAADTPAAARAMIAEHLPSAILPALTQTDLERIRLHLGTLPLESLMPRIGRDDYHAAIGVFLLVFLSLVPVVIPFLFFADVALALRISNAIAVGLLFLTGFTFGRHVGRPWQVGFSMVAVGIALVAVAMALGG